MCAKNLRLDRWMVENGPTPKRARKPLRHTSWRATYSTATTRRVDKSRSSPSCPMPAFLVRTKSRYVSRGRPETGSGAPRLRNRRDGDRGLRPISAPRPVALPIACSSMERSEVHCVDAGTGCRLIETAQVIRVSSCTKASMRATSKSPSSASLLIWLLATSAFISATAIIPAIARILKRRIHGWMVVLIKPQFESAKARLGRW